MMWHGPCPIQITTDSGTIDFLSKLLSVNMLEISMGFGDFELDK